MRSKEGSGKGEYILRREERRWNKDQLRKKGRQAKEGREGILRRNEG